MLLPSLLVAAISSLVSLLKSAAMTDDGYKPVLYLIDDSQGVSQPTYKNRKQSDKTYKIIFQLRFIMLDAYIYYDYVNFFLQIYRFSSTISLYRIDFTLTSNPSHIILKNKMYFSSYNNQLIWRFFIFHFLFSLKSNNS